MARPAASDEADAGRRICAEIQEAEVSKDQSRATVADNKREEMILKDVVNVLRAGNALKNPEKWKKGHWLVSMVSLLVTSVAGLLKWKFPDLVLDNDTLNLIIQLGCFVLAAANGYLIPATTEKPLTKKGAAKVKEKQDPPAVKPMVKHINPGHEVK